MKKTISFFCFLLSYLAHAQNVGINNPLPQFPLSFNGSLGDKISLWNDGSATHYGLGIQSGTLQIFSKSVSDNIAFGYGSSTSFTEMMRIKSNGNVGIGITNPLARLHIAAGDASFALFGPNLYGGQLYVGAAANQGVALAAQVLATDGNLHIDPAAGKNLYLGYFQSRNIYLNPNGGNIGIGTTLPTAALEVNGYTKMGSTAPSIKVKKIIGTTASAEGSSVSIAHGLDNSKILSVSIIVIYYAADNNITGPNWQGSGYNFYWFINAGNIIVVNRNGDSAYLLSKTIKILITYEE